MGKIQSGWFRIWDLCCQWRLRSRGVVLGSKVHILGMPIVSMVDPGSIRIGTGVILCSRSESTALGVAHPVILRTMAPGARITLGEHSGLSGTTICAAQSVEIGSHCLFGADVQVVDTDFHPIAPEGRRYSSEGVAIRPVKIGNNVFLGARCMVLKGVSIGDNSVVGAGSIVASDLPANCIAAGVPAKVVRTF